MLREALARLRSAVFGRCADAELDEEIRFHLAEDTDERIDSGVAPEQARRAARLDFGNPAAIREATRDAWGWGPVERACQDVRYAVTAARRSPSFALASVTTLALGIGATTAVFSVVDGVLLRPLPYPEPARLVRLSEVHPGAAAPLSGNLLSNLTFHAWRANASQTLAGIAAYRPTQHTVGFLDGPARLAGAAFTPSLFDVLGVAPAAGRLFEAGDAGEGAAPVVVLSDRLWRQRLGADPAVVGRAIPVDGRTHVIVGVAPPGFSFPGPDVLLWTPYAVPVSSGSGDGRHVSTVLAVGRLERDASPAQAAAEGTAAARGMGPRPLAAIMLFGAGGPVEVRVQGLADEMTAEVRPALVAISVAVALVLLMACANIASLLLSRGLARERELAVRAALGASRGRIARQLFTETAVLALAGGALGLLLAWALVSAVPVLAPSDFPRLGDIRMNERAAACALAASLLATAMCGLLPAVRSARRDVAGALQGGGTPGGSARDVAQRWRAALLLTEAALAVLLLVGAALLARSFVRLVSIDAGYDHDRVITARVVVPAGAAAPERTQQLVAAVLERLAGMPQVVAGGAGNMMPFGGHTFLSAFSLPAVDGSPVEARALEYAVTPGYAEALGLRLRQGRFFTSEDVISGVQPVLVNEEFARRYLPPALDAERIIATGMGSRGTPSRIVGIVGNVLKDGLDAAPQPEIYLPLGPDARIDEVYLVLRTAEDPAALAAAVRAVVREADTMAAIHQLAPVAQLVSASVARPRFAASVLAAFAAVALVLAAVGLYGVLSYVVSQRRHELGVRAALGAARADLIAVVIGTGLTPTLVGIGVGLCAAALLTRLLDSLLFGITPLDPIAFLAAPAILVPAALAASLHPALRAASADPAAVLKVE